VAGTLDGFELSRIDLEQRREGDVLGASQSGSRSHLRLLRVLRDEFMIEQAREDATTILDSGIGNYPLLATELAQIQADAMSEFIEKA
jgi:ATP-dependent DNA helicase RecG